MNIRISFWRIVLIVWLVFSAFYVVYNEWSRFQVYVMQNSYNQGVEDAVAKLITESKNCKGFPVNLGDKSVTLVNVECLKPQVEAGAPKANK